MTPASVHYGTSDEIWNERKKVLEMAFNKHPERFVKGAPLPPKGSVIGAGTKTLCDECPRVRSEKKIKKFHRPWEIIPDNETCLLEQGIVCAGPATRAGCGAKCINANQACRGCYGPPDGVLDQGAKLLGALASVIDATDPQEIEAILDTIPDVAGTVYRFSLPSSILRRKAIKK